MHAVWGNAAWHRLPPPRSCPLHGQDVPSLLPPSLPSCAAYPSTHTTPFFPASCPSSLPQTGPHIHQLPRLPLQALLLLVCSTPGAPPWPAQTRRNPVRPRGRVCVRRAIGGLGAGCGGTRGKTAKMKDTHGIPCGWHVRLFRVCGVCLCAPLPRERPPFRPPRRRPLALCAPQLVFVALSTLPFAVGQVHDVG